MNKAISILLAFALAVSLAGCTERKEETVKDGVQIALSDEGVTVDGAPVTGEETAAVYTANDIVFYLAGQGFTYGEGSEADEHTQAEADAIRSCISRSPVPTGSAAGCPQDRLRHFS